jgi:peptidoglycan/xylan/chitin deacetylase (PgdA/CDA1 family)
MYPLLKDYGMKANIFLVPAFLYNEQINPGDGDSVYLQLNDIKSMDPQRVEFGLHSFDHRNYKTLAPKELDADISLSKAMLLSMGIPFQPCLAFPYGSYPSGHSRQTEFFQVLRNNRIAISFRIGNRINQLPLKNKMLIQRLDVERHDTLEKFDRVMRRGKSIF